MSDVLKKIRNFMEKEGIPGRDAYDLPTSSKTFPDGANYRIEIAGVERASTMEAMIAEAHKRKLTIHRAIAAVGGSTYCDFQELKDMAQMARDEGIEMIMTVGHRKGWDAGSKEMSTPEGAMQGFRLRGSDSISYHIADIMRNIEAGHRGFLVYDEGVLSHGGQLDESLIGRVAADFRRYPKGGGFSAGCLHHHCRRFWRHVPGIRNTGDRPHCLAVLF